MTVNVTIPLDDGAKADLDAWADADGVSVSTVLSQVVDAFVTERREIEAAVAEARADILADRVHSHDDVVAELKARRSHWAAE